MMTLCVKRAMQFDHRNIYFYIVIAMVLKRNYIEEQMFFKWLDASQNICQRKI